MTSASYAELSVESFERFVRRHTRRLWIQIAGVLASEEGERHPFVRNLERGAPQPVEPCPPDPEEGLNRHPEPQGYAGQVLSRAQARIGEQAAPTLPVGNGNGIGIGWGGALGSPRLDSIVRTSLAQGGYPRSHTSAGSAASPWCSMR